MHCFDTIKRILSEPLVSSGLLMHDLIVVSPPATATQLAALERSFHRPLSEQHRQLLLMWDGLNLDVVRFFSASASRSGITSLLDAQALIPSAHPSWIAVASDPAGFLYAEDENGSVWSIDHDGGGQTRVAACLDEFIGGYVFGERAAEFGGESWRDDLVTHGLLPAA
jgi:SMI1/KNR4 family protein SUKH-1